MSKQATRVFILALLVAFSAGLVGAQELEKLKKPEPAVPEVFTIEGQFVRLAYNNEGFATLGYRLANDSVAEEWMALEIGLTLRKGVKNQSLKRDAISLQMPDGSTLGLAGQKEFADANLRALDARANMIRDSINYFPVGSNQACRIGFFTDISQPGRGLAYDQVDLSWQRGCLGRIYFHIPDGITTGQYYLNIKFAESVVQVPFRIMTKAEEKEFKKKWKGMKKEHDASYQQ